MVKGRLCLLCIFPARYQAAMDGNIATTQTKAIMRLLEYGANTFVKDSEGMTPVHWLAAFGYHDLIVNLDKTSSHLEDVNNKGKTPIFFAVEFGQGKTVEKLYERGANIYATDSHGNTLLHHTAQKWPEIFEWLVAKGLKINSSNNNGSLPIHDAAFNFNLEILKTIISMGASVNAVDNEGQTRGCSENIKYLVSCGANINAIDNG